MSKEEAIAVEKGQKIVQQVVGGSTEEKLMDRIVTGQTPTAEETLEMMEKRLQTHKKEATTFEGESAAENIVKVVTDAKNLLQEEKVGDRLKAMAEHGWKAAQEAKEMVPQKEEVRAALPGQEQNLLNLLSTIMEESRSLIMELIYSTDFRNTIGEIISLLSNFFRRKIEEGPSSYIPSTSKDVAGSSAPGFGVFPTFGVPLSATEEAYTPTAPSTITHSREEEFLDELTNRLISLLRSISSTSRYNMLIRHLLDLSDQLTETNETISSLINRGKQENAQNQLLLFWEDARGLLNSFAPGKIDDVLDSLNICWRIFTDNNELKSWFQEMKVYINKIIEQPDLLDNPQIRQDGRYILQRGRSLVDFARFEAETTRVDDKWNELLNALQNHPTLSALQRDLTNLANDLVWRDPSTNQLHYRPTAFSDIGKVLRAVIAEELSTLRLPKFEGEDESIKYIVENGILKGGMAPLPDRFVVQAKQVAELNVNTASAEKLELWLKFVMTGIDIELMNLNFWFKKKTFPSMEDRGVSNLKLKDMDINVSLLLEKDFAIIPHQVEANIGKLDIDVEEAKHQILLKMYTTLWSNSLRKNFEKSIEEKVRSIMEIFNMMLSSTVKNMKANLSPNQIATAATMLTSS